MNFEDILREQSALRTYEQGGMRRPAVPAQYEAPTHASIMAEYQPQGDFTRGWQSGLYGLAASDYADRALQAEYNGNMTEMASNLRRMGDAQRVAEAFSPETTSIVDVFKEGPTLEGLRSYAAGGLGQGIASMTPILATQLPASALAAAFPVLRAASFIPGALTGMGMERGETAMSQYNDERLASAPVEERMKAAQVKGAIAGALEAVVPFALGKTLFSIPKSMASIPRNIAKNAVEEAATEAAQTLTGQMANRYIDPTQEFDAKEMLDAALMGAMTGGYLTAQASAPGGFARMAINAIKQADDEIAAAAREKLIRQGVIQEESDALFTKIQAAVAQSGSGDAVTNDLVRAAFESLDARTAENLMRADADHASVLNAADTATAIRELDATRQAKAQEYAEDLLGDDSLNEADRERIAALGGDYSSTAAQQVIFSTYAARAYEAKTLIATDALMRATGKGEKYSFFDHTPTEAMSKALRLNLKGEFQNNAGLLESLDALAPQLDKFFTHALHDIKGSGLTKEDTTALASLWPVLEVFGDRKKAITDFLNEALLDERAKAADDRSDFRGKLRLAAAENAEEHLGAIADRMLAYIDAVNSASADLQQAGMKNAISEIDRVMPPSLQRSAKDEMRFAVALDAAIRGEMDIGTLVEVTARNYPGVDPNAIIGLVKRKQADVEAARESLQKVLVERGNADAIAVAAEEALQQHEEDQSAGVEQSRDDKQPDEEFSTSEQNANQLYEAAHGLDIRYWRPEYGRPFVKSATEEKHGALTEAARAELEAKGYEIKGLGDAIAEAGASEGDEYGRTAVHEEFVRQYDNISARLRETEEKHNEYTRKQKELEAKLLAAEQAEDGVDRSKEIEDTKNQIAKLQENLAYTEQSYQRLGAQFGLLHDAHTAFQKNEEQQSTLRQLQGQRQQLGNTATQEELKESIRKMRFQQGLYAGKDARPEKYADWAKKYEAEIEKKGDLEKEKAALVAERDALVKKEQKAKLEKKKLPPEEAKRLRSVRAQIGAKNRKLNDSKRWLDSNARAYEALKNDSADTRTKVAEKLRAATEALKTALPTSEYQKQLASIDEAISGMEASVAEYSPNLLQNVLNELYIAPVRRSVDMQKEELTDADLNGARKGLEFQGGKETAIVLRRRKPGSEETEKITLSAQSLAYIMGRKLGADAWVKNERKIDRDRRLFLQAIDSLTNRGGQENPEYFYYEEDNLDKNGDPRPIGDIVINAASGAKVEQFNVRRALEKDAALQMHAEAIQQYAEHIELVAGELYTKLMYGETFVGADENTTAREAREALADELKEEVFTEKYRLQALKDTELQPHERAFIEAKIAVLDDALARMNDERDYYNSQNSGTADKIDSMLPPTLEEYWQDDFETWKKFEPKTSSSQTAYFAAQGNATVHDLLQKLGAKVPALKNPEALRFDGKDIPLPPLEVTEKGTNTKRNEARNRATELANRYPRVSAGEIFELLKGDPAPENVNAVAKQVQKLQNKRENHAKILHNFARKNELSDSLLAAVLQEEAKTEQEQFLRLVAQHELADKPNVKPLAKEKLRELVGAAEMGKARAPIRAQAEKEREAAAHEEAKSEALSQFFADARKVLKAAGFSSKKPAVVPWLTTVKRAIREGRLTLPKEYLSEAELPAKIRQMAKTFKEYGERFWEGDADAKIVEVADSKPTGQNPIWRELMSVSGDLKALKEKVALNAQQKGIDSDVAKFIKEVLEDYNNRAAADENKAAASFREAHKAPGKMEAPERSEQEQKPARNLQQGKYQCDIDVVRAALKVEKAAYAATIRLYLENRAGVKGVLDSDKSVEDKAVSLGGYGFTPRTAKNLAGRTAAEVEETISSWLDDGMSIDELLNASATIYAPQQEQQQAAEQRAKYWGEDLVVALRESGLKLEELAKRDPRKFSIENELPYLMEALQNEKWRKALQEFHDTWLKLDPQERGNKKLFELPYEGERYAAEQRDAKAEAPKGEIRGETYNRKDVVWFFGSKGKYGILSGDAWGKNGGINFEGAKAPNADALMYALLHAETDKEFEAVLAASNYSERTKVCKAAKLENAQYEAARQFVLRLKLVSNWDKIAPMLLRTENKPLVCEVPADSGIRGVETTVVLNSDTVVLAGANRTGEGWMQIRSTLRGMLDNGSTLQEAKTAFIQEVTRSSYMARFRGAGAFTRIELAKNVFQAPVFDANGVRVNTLRKFSAEWKHRNFGNPFSATENFTGVISTKTVKESVEKYENWLKNGGLPEHEQRRQWILAQLRSGSLIGKTLLYYTNTVPKNLTYDGTPKGTKKYNEKTAPHHAHVLKKLIEEHKVVVDAVARSREKIVSGNPQEQTEAVERVRAYISKHEGSTLFTKRQGALAYKEMLEQLGIGMSGSITPPSMQEAAQGQAARVEFGAFGKLKEHLNTLWDNFLNDPKAAKGNLLTSLERTAALLAQKQDRTDVETARLEGYRHLWRKINQRITSGDTKFTQDTDDPYNAIREAWKHADADVRAAVVQRMTVAIKELDQKANKSPHEAFQQRLLEALRDEFHFGVDASRSAGMRGFIARIADRLQEVRNNVYKLREGLDWVRDEVQRLEASNDTITQLKHNELSRLYNEYTKQLDSLAAEKTAKLSDEEQAVFDRLKLEKALPENYPLKGAELVFSGMNRLWEIGARAMGASAWSMYRKLSPQQAKEAIDGLNSVGIYLKGFDESQQQELKSMWHQIKDATSVYVNVGEKSKRVAAALRIAEKLDKPIRRVHADGSVDFRENGAYTKTPVKRVDFGRRVVVVGEGASHAAVADALYGWATDHGNILPLISPKVQVQEAHPAQEPAPAPAPAPAPTQKTAPEVQLPLFPPQETAPAPEADTAPLTQWDTIDSWHGANDRRGDAQIALITSTGKDHGEFGNFHRGFPFKIQLDGGETVYVKTSEHLYQALKFPNKPDVQREILAAPSPTAAKNIGRNTEMEKTDERKTLRRMEWVLRAKLAANLDNPDMKAAIAKVGDKLLVEYSSINRGDKFWAAVPDKKSYDTYRGQNWLGKLLNKILAEYKDTGRIDTSVPAGADIKLYGQTIGDVIQPKKQSLLGTRVGGASPSELKAALEEITRLRGDEVRTAVEELGAGEAGVYLRTQRLIVLAYNAAHPLSVARHEAMHDFFAELMATPQGRAMRRILLNATNTPFVRKQLNELLKKYPKAKEQLEDAEERLAYAYQFWASGQLKLVPEATNIFQKIRKFFRHMFNVVSESQKAEVLLKHFHSGTFKGNAQEIAQIYDQLNQRTMRERLDKLSPKIGVVSDRLVTAPTVRLREFGRPALTKLADMFADEETGAGFMQDRVRVQSVWENKLAAILEGTSAEERNTALANLQSMKAPRSALERKLDTLLKGMFKYLTDSKVHTMEVTEHTNPKTGEKSKRVRWRPIQKTERYFPRVWDRSAILADPDAFVNLIAKHGDMSTGEAYKLMARILGEEQEELSELPESAHGYSPFMSASSHRGLTFINESNAADFVRFQSKDLTNVMATYIRQAAHRGEFSKTFGYDGRVISQAMGEAFVDPRNPKEENVDVEGIKDASYSIRALEGTLGAEKMQPTTSAVMSAVMTMENVILLPLAVFSQVVDPVVLAARSGSLRDAMSAFARVAKALAGKKDYHDDLAAICGITSRESVLDAMGMSYASTHMGEKARKVNSFFFKWNGMQLWNNSMRVAATAAGERYLLENANDAEKLAEVGLKVGDVKKTKDGHLDVKSEKVQKALFAFVDQAVLRPSAANRPVWMSDPRFMLVAHLKQFTFAMHKVVMARAFKELDKGNRAPLLILTLAVPFILASDMLKTAMTGTFPTHWDASDWFLHAIERSGLLGQADFVAQMTDGRGLPGETLLGPAFEHLMTVLRGLLGVGDTSLRDVVNRTVPLARYVPV